MSNMNLSFVISAVNNASDVLKKVQGDVNNITKSASNAGQQMSDWATQNRATFAKTALAGGVAFGAISYGASQAVNSAAEAEGAWNKFNTVFGESSDEMTAFVKDMRTRMPVATDTIAKMSADLQDLLVPMGLTREEAMGLTQQSIELTNKIVAFNDADPSDVLSAMRSGFRGVSQPLSEFGIDASVAALEARALSEGLLEQGQTFQSLDPLVRKSIQSQALMAQMIASSADAIDGFEDNADSYIMRQLEINATIEDVIGHLGTGLLPVFDAVLKSILPIVEQISHWTQENPELTKTIILATGATAGVIMIIGKLGLLLPGIISTVGFFGGAFAALLSPIGLVVGAIGLLAVAWYNDWGNMREITQTVMTFIQNFIQSALDALWVFWEKYGEKIISIAKISREMISTVITVVLQAIRKAIEGWVFLITYIRDNRGDTITSSVGMYFDIILNAIQTTLQTVQKVFGIFWKMFSGDWKGAWNAASNLFSNVFSGIADWLTGRLDWSYGVMSEFRGWITGSTAEVTRDLNKIPEIATVAMRDLEVQVMDTVNRSGDRGENLIQGMVNGIESRFPQLRAKASEAAGIIKNFLGVQSPTKEGPLQTNHLWGGNLVQSFADGMQKNIPEIQKWALKVSQAAEMMNLTDDQKKGVLQKASDIFSPPSLLYGRAPTSNISSALPTSTLSSTSNTATGQQGVVIQNLTINVPIDKVETDLDPEQLADEVEKIFQKKMRLYQKGVLS